MMYTPVCVPGVGVGSGVMDGCEQPLESSLWPAAWGMPLPGLLSLSVNPTGLIVHGRLAGLAVSLPDCGRNKGNPLLVHGSGCLFSLCTVFQPLYELHVCVVSGGKDGL